MIYSAYITELEERPMSTLDLIWKIGLLFILLLRIKEKKSK